MRTENILYCFPLIQYIVKQKIPSCVINPQRCNTFYFFTDINMSDSEALHLSQSTAASNWSDMQKSSRERYNDAMQMLTNGHLEFLRSQASQPLQDLQYSTRAYYVRHAKAAFEFICDIIAPGQGHDLVDEVVCSYRSSSSVVSQQDSMTDTVVEAYKKAADHTTRTQILSLIANKYSKATLLKMIEGMTIHQIDMARKHAATYWPGHYVDPPKIVRVRISKGKIQHFIEFISAPMYLHTVGFGSKHLKLSSGLEVKIPKVIRTMIASRLITAYVAYCQDNDIVPPSRATLYKIVKVCAASQMKSLHGIDNLASEGESGISIIEKAVEKLSELGLDELKVKDFKNQLQAVKLHLKNDFKTHLITKSTCIEHCMQYALSDSPCDHEHSETCSSCHQVKNVTTEIAQCLKGVHCEANVKEEIQHDVDLSCEKIVNWRNHCIRTVNQDACKRDILNDLREDQGFIIMDWAMKYLPQTFRETQSEWFGKQGISWHVSCVLVRRNGTEDDEPLDILSYVHLLQNGTQGWFTVSKILTHTLQMLHESHPHLREVYLRSDNAGCYHCTPLLACLWKLRNDSFVTIREYNFSEAQSGKDLCDSRTGSCRMHILNYINEGNNVTNVFEMKDALESHGGVRNTFTSIIDVDMSTQPVLSGQLQIPISQYNNFTFMDSGILAFKSYGFGEQLIPSEKLESVTKNMMDIQEAMVRF